MARKLRVQYPGAIYHVMNRGDRRQAIFIDEADRGLLIATLGQACKKTDWQIHAWCLMSNHFHRVIETPRANLVEGMHWLLGVYTSRFNHRHKEFGHLFSGRCKALIVDGSGNGYLKAVCDYVHLNPVRAGLIGLAEPRTQFQEHSALAEACLLAANYIVGSRDLTIIAMGKYAGNVLIFAGGATPRAPAEGLASDRLGFAGDEL